jgi:autotransporter-associated beta strand protein
MRETLNFTGGTLNINYVPSWDSTPISAQFSGPVTISGSASLSVHTLQVDAARTFTLNGGTLTFNTINLMPGATPAKLAMGGDVTFNSLAGATATIINGAGTGASGFVDLGGATHAFNIASNADLVVAVPISNGGLAKTGLGNMRVTAANTYSGGTTISTGKLLVNNPSGSGTGSGSVNVNGGVLGGSGTISGPVTINPSGTISPGPGTSIGSLTLDSSPILNGTNFMKIDRNGGAPIADKLVLSSGTLSYGGTLVVSNSGATLTGGEVFALFDAQSYSGAFEATQLPTLNGGLNWHLGDLTSNGSIKVNRSPVANPLTFTNTPAAQLQIPITSLIANATDPDGDTITLASVDLTSTNGVTLLTNSTFILYSNSINVADRFNYTINDGHGGSATGVVNIAPGISGQFIGVPSMNGSSATLHFAGNPGTAYYLERSTNLPVWLTISTNIMPANGVLDYTDDFHDLNQPPTSAFYRLSWMP